MELRGRRGKRNRKKARGSARREEGRKNEAINKVSERRGKEEEETKRKNRKRRGRGRRQEEVKEGKKRDGK